KTAIHNAKAAWAKYEHNVTFIDLSVEKTMWSCLLKLTEDLHLPFIAKFFRIYIDISNIRTFLRVKLFSRDRAFLLEGIVDGGNIDRDFYIGLYAEQIETFLNNLTNTNYEKLVNDGLYELPANKSLALFEKAIDEYIIDWFRPTKYMAFGMEPLIAYLFYKQIEVKNLRHVVLSKIAGLNADEISLYLRMM
ncbi:V-type ATPase subunit, partial [bacterium]|nr:V-type ATPase subunit [bacterium]